MPVAKACGTHLVEDSWRTDQYSCEHYLLTLIENDAGEQEQVLVLSYSEFEGGFNNATCPSMPTFNEVDLENDPNLAGKLLDIFQSQLSD